MNTNENKSACFYYSLDGKIVEEKTEGIAGLNFFYFNPIGKILRSLINKKYSAQIYAAYQNSKLSKSKIKPFVKRYNIEVSEFEKAVSEFQSFNDFFVRKLKPGSRLIDADPKVLTSPADSKLLVIENVSDDIEFFVKNKRFNLSRFLGDEKLAEQYKNGVLMIFRLAPYDYHRFHFPTDCVPSAPKIIHGLYDSVNPVAYKSGIQPLTENERHIIMLKTEQFSDVLCVAVGAMLVGRIVHTNQSEQKYKKGNEMGYFEFGGSTIALLFKQGVIKPNSEFIQHSAQGFETAVKMGQSVVD